MPIHYRFPGSLTLPTPTNAPPTGESVGAVYLDDGTNTGSGNPGWRYLVSTGPDVWADVGGGGGTDFQADFADTWLYTLAASPIEEVVGQAVFDGSRVGAATARFFGMITPTFAAAGTGYLRLYDMGPAAGPPEAAFLIATLSTVAGGGPQYFDQALVVAGAKGVNQIVNAPRMYEARAFMSGTTGDTLLVGGGGMDVR